MSKISRLSKLREKILKDFREQSPIHSFFMASILLLISSWLCYQLINLPHTTLYSILIIELLLMDIVFIILIWRSFFKMLTIFKEMKK